MFLCSSAARVFTGVLFSLQTPELKYHSKYRFKDLRNCLRDLHMLHRKAPEASLQAVREKYSHSNTEYVAYIRTMPDPDSEKPKDRWLDDGYELVDSSCC